MAKIARKVCRRFFKFKFFACVASAGLANSLAQLLSGQSWKYPSFQEADLEGHINPRLPTIIVCGSRHPSSITQLQKFLHSSGQNSCVIEGPGERDVDVGDIVRNVSPQRPTLVVRAAPGLKEPRVVAEWLARTTYRVLGALGPGQLVLMGGDTAFRVCEWLGVKKLAIRSMESPGISVCEPVGLDAVKARKIILKPGGFGSPSALVDILKN